MSECTLAALERDLFTGEEILPGQYKVPRKYQTKTAADKRRDQRLKKTVQYKIKLKVRLTDRKIGFRNRLHELAGNETDVFDFSQIGYKAFLIQMLDYIPHELAELISVGSNRVSEIVSWINRRWTDEPFSFEECCRSINVDPASKREQLLETIEELYDGRTDHYTLIRNRVIDAEAGDVSAVQWVMCEQETGLSFNVCCRALGFNPSKARQEVIIPSSVLEQLPELLDVSDALKSSPRHIFETQAGMFEDPRLIVDPVVQDAFDLEDA